MWSDRSVGNISTLSQINVHKYTSYCYQENIDNDISYITFSFHADIGNSAGLSMSVKTINKTILEAHDLQGYQSPFLKLVIIYNESLAWKFCAARGSFGFLSGWTCRACSHKGKCLRRWTLNHFTSTFSLRHRESKEGRRIKNRMD